MKDKQIFNSIEAIEPKADAETRMYRNIMRKAENTERRNIKAGAMRIVKILLPAAACILITALSLIVFKPFHGESQPKNLLTLQTAPVSDCLQTPQIPSETPICIYRSDPGKLTESSDQTVLPAYNFPEIGVSVELPAGAESVSYKIFDGNNLKMSFNLNGHIYGFTASKSEKDFSGLNGKAISEEIINGNAAILFYAVGTDSGTAYKLKWESGGVRYLLWNTDGAGKAEICAAYEAIIIRNYE